MAKPEVTLLSDLNSDHPAAVAAACERITPAHAALPGMRARLLALLDDGRDWDCNCHVCGAAALALARLEPNGTWIDEAAGPFRRHVERHATGPATAIVHAVRQASGVPAFLDWCWRALPEAAAAPGGWAQVVLDCYPEYRRDETVIRAILVLKDADSSVVLWRDLIAQELIARHVSTLPDFSDKARNQFRNEAKRYGRLTADAPADLRQEVADQLREHGYSRECAK